MDGDQPMVSYSTGSMNSLVDKLTKLKNRPDIILELRQDLVTLQEDFFDKFARRREMNLQVEAWMKHVRELVFDIEDWIDRKPVLTGMLDQQTKIEEEIEEFKAQIKQARELCERYNLLAVQVRTDVHDPAVVPGQDRIDSALFFEKKNGLVGVDGPIEELVRLLTGKDEKKLKVVSILGKEGLGKTNLAKEIYAKPQLHRQFECHAFVTLGRRPSMRATLIEILRQVKLDSIHEHQGHSRSRSGRGTAKDLQKIITELWEYLGTKRYFILVDGLWSTRAWKVINCALPNENRGSRVLTTTCMSDVAKCCSVHPADVYQMKVLTEEDSTSLYQQSIQQEESSANYDKVTKNMLEMCGGMPLAITVTAGLSGMTSEEQEELANMFGNCFLSSQEQYSTSEGMMKILHMSYATLSLPLKSCFLYLSVFREDYIIKKDRLIQLWVAEGFIPGDEERLWDTGEKYFNELIIRRLIQPVFDYDDDQAVGCTVHSVILDFIRAMSSKGNFVTVSGAELSSGLFSGSTDMIRRFSLNCYKDEDEDEGASGSGSDNGTLGLSTLHLSRVRSVTICGDIEGMVGRSALTNSGEIKGTPVLQSFKLLRVLDLEGTDHLRSRHLQGIVGLVLLRYLGVAGTDIDELPEEIGELEQLETLDLRQTKKLSTLPTSIAKLKRLARLLIDGTVNLSSEILKMHCLEQLSTAGVDSIHSMDSVVELLKTSERLRVLGVRLEGSHLSSDNKSVKSFLMEVEKSTKLRSLSLACVHKDLLGLLMEFPPSYHLPRFELAISFPINGGDVHKMAPLVSVTHMEIEIDQLDPGAVRVLGGLPNLVLLKLVSSGIINSQSRKSKKSPINSGQKRCMVGTVDGFKCLKVFWLTCQYGGTELEFTAGAMPDLQRLSLRFNARETLSLYGDFSFGIQNLPSLTRVHATINCKAATVSEVKDAEDAIKEQAADTAIREEATGQVSSVPMTEFSTINQHMMLLPDKEHTTTSPGRVSRFISSFTKGIHSNK